MTNRQEVITKEDAERGIEERKSVGLENRLNERHQLRMDWYRNRMVRQAAALAFSALVFSAVTYVAATYGWLIATLAAVCAGVLIVIQAIINGTSQPPEDRNG